MIRESGAQWTILRSAWFAQNFSEAFLAGMVANGVLALQAGDAAEPFVAVDDLADVGGRVDRGPARRQVYEVTGPQPLTFAAATQVVARANGRPVPYQPITGQAFAADMTAAGLPGDLIGGLDEVFAERRAGRNASAADGLERPLGRPPRGFAEFARTASLTADADSWTARRLGPRCMTRLRITGRTVSGPLSGFPVICAVAVRYVPMSTGRGHEAPRLGRRGAG